ncbi:hypothetical protein BSZ35_12605 [Salinibacter sp. 10B]|uniref:hypothetical protein n=1 Tax=Salinibacter sp. 10B TaxID=1923971 RepID=UPI000CF4C495|nr:hypothetical protein [Salinibacter sp. 10B]PQJ35330.1 hypothetical protein BSZ35_12605 [Salinibacter sp. 10B]
MGPITGDHDQETRRCLTHWINEGYLWREVDVPGVPYAQYVATRTKDGSTRYVRTREPTVDEEALDALRSGEVVALDAPVAAGDMLWWSGAFGLPSGEVAITDAYERGPTVHWEVFAADKAFGHEDGVGDGSEAGAWSVFEDQNDDHRLDPREVEAAGQLQDRWAESTAAETDTFAKAPSEERSPFFIMEAPWSRRIAAKFRSEWGVKDVETVMADEKGYEADGRAAMKRLQWWDEVRDARSAAGSSVELPEDATVWHYHPVGALEAIRPRFTAEGDNTTLDGPVETIEDVADQVIGALGYSGDLFSLDEQQFERVRSEMDYERSSDSNLKIKVAAPATEAPEEFAHVHFEPNRYGHATFNGANYFLGIFATSTGAGDPELYEMLQEGSPIEGVPGRTPVESASETPMDWFGEMEKNIWASLTASEGSLQALNTYDTAFLSVGPVQQTAGAGEAKGELQGALDTLREHAEETYWRHFGRFGLKPVGATIQGGAKKAHVELNGEVLDTPEKKERLRRFKWAHRFQEAMQDPTVRYWIMREGFKRLDRIRDWDATMQLPDQQGKPQEMSVRLQDVFQSDLGQALILDAHINRPGLVVPYDDDNVWTSKATSLLKSRNGTASDPTLTPDEERQLIEAILQNRVDSPMSDPEGRAIGILKYTSDEVVQTLATTNQLADQPQTVPAFLTRVLNLAENRDHSGEGAWGDIQGHEAEPLSFRRE